MRIGPATPIFRMFDQAKAREFYVDYLGFAIVFEHRFEENFPLYMGLERDGLTLHLSEHHGDCCPGGAIRVESALSKGSTFSFTLPCAENDSA